MIAYGRMSNSIFLRGSQRKKSVNFGVLPNHSPPTGKGRMFAMRSMTLLRPAGRWRGDAEWERGKNGDEVHGADAVFVVGYGRKY